MRYSIFFLLAAGFLATSVQAEQPAIGQQISAYLTAHPMPRPNATVAERKKATDLVVVFKLDRDGKLLNPKITKSSGSAIFDQATLDWLVAVQPFPAMPIDHETSQEFVLPMRFMSPPGGLTYEEDEQKIKKMIGNVCKGC